MGLNNSGLTLTVVKLDKIVKTALEGSSRGVRSPSPQRTHRLHGATATSIKSAGSPAVDTNTLYDLASLTKVIATTTLAMIPGKRDNSISIAPRPYLPEFNHREQITIGAARRTAADWKRAPTSTARRAAAAVPVQINARRWSTRRGPT